MTIEQINEQIKQCEESIRISRELAQEEEDKDYRRSYYEKIDIINERIAKLIKLKHLIEMDGDVLAIYLV